MTQNMSKRLVGGCRPDPSTRCGVFRWSALPQHVIDRLLTHVEDHEEQKAISGAFKERVKSAKARGVVTRNACPIRPLPDADGTIRIEIKLDSDTKVVSFPLPPAVTGVNNYARSRGFKIYREHYVGCSGEYRYINEGAEPLDNLLTLTFGARQFSRLDNECKKRNYPILAGCVHPAIQILWDAFHNDRFFQVDIDWSEFFLPVFRNLNAAKTFLLLLIVHAIEENLGPEYVSHRFEVFRQVISGKDMCCCPGILFSAPPGFGKTAAIVFGLFLVDTDLFKDTYVSPGFLKRLVNSGFSVVTNNWDVHKIAHEVFVIHFTSKLATLIQRIKTKRVFSTAALKAQLAIKRQRKKFFRENKDFPGRMRPLSDWTSAFDVISKHPDIVVYNLTADLYLIDGLYAVITDLIGYLG